MGNKAIQRWSWLYTPNPAPTRLHLNVWFGFYIHPQFSGTPWLHIRGCMWNGLGEDGGEMQRERSGAGCLGLAWQVLQPFIKAAWQVFQEWGEWVSERTSSHIKPSQQTWIVLFCYLNEVSVLGTFHIFTVCCTEKGRLLWCSHRFFSYRNTVRSCCFKAPLHSALIGSLTSSLTLSYYYSSLLLWYAISEVVDAVRCSANHNRGVQHYNHNLNIVFVLMWAPLLSLQVFLRWEILLHDMRMTNLTPTEMFKCICSCTFLLSSVNIVLIDQQLQDPRLKVAWKAQLLGS